MTVVGDEHQHAMTIAGVVLAGGQSRRMGGGDKALLTLSGRPMIAHVLARLAPQASPLAINANGDPQRFAAFGLPVIADTIEGFAGPLAGVLAGLKWARAHAPQCPYIVTVSADAPLVPADLVARLSAAVGDARDHIALAQSEGQTHPVIGLWPVALADDLEKAVGDGVRKVLHWTRNHAVHEVAFPPFEVGGTAVDPFFNANTPSDFAELEALIARDAPGTRPGTCHE